MGSSQKNTKIILFINMQVSSLNNPIIPFRCHIKKDREKIGRGIFLLCLGHGQ